VNREWYPLPAAGVDDGTILFDGICVLCSWWVRFLIERDPAARFRFVPIQSPYGGMLASQFGINVEAPETNVVVVDGMAHFKADAAIAVLTQLPGWSWASALRLLPRPVRNWLYDRVARNRYRLFGRTDACLMPTPDIARRFLFDGPV
jgi:predicted DCC family thiol-disulfide oxidoreductase YuxK